MTRAKHVFKSEEIGHAFAHQTSAHGRRSDGRMYFDACNYVAGRGRAVSTIYSYGRHFPIATLWDIQKGASTRTPIQRVALVTTQKYSVSTSRHVDYVRSCIPSDWRVFVYDPQEPNQEFGVATRAIAAHWKHANDPKSRTISTDLNAIERIAQSANDLARLFGFVWRVKVPNVKRLRARASELDAKQKERDANRETRREELRLVRALKNLSDWRVNPSDRTPSYEAQQSKYWTAEDAKLLALRETNAIELWRANGGNAWQLSGTYLRLNGTNIETSKGASFPVSHGRRAWPFILQCRDTATAWESNGHRVHLGHYHLDKIDADGNVEAGCHHVPFVEIERIAKELGL